MVNRDEFAYYIYVARQGTSRVLAQNGGFELDVGHLNTFVGLRWSLICHRCLPSTQQRGGHQRSLLLVVQHSERNARLIKPCKNHGKIEKNYLRKSGILGANLPVPRTSWRNLRASSDSAQQGTLLSWTWLCNERKAICSSMFRQVLDLLTVR